MGAQLTPDARAAPPARHVRFHSWRDFPAFTLLGLAVAWFGFHWDIATHIDVGRDGFVTVPHVTIIIGALLALVSAVGRSWRLRSVGRVRAGDITSMAGGGLVFTALALDNWWHSVFGTDVTVWSPPHLLLMAAFMLILLGVLRTAVEGEFNPVVVCGVAAFTFSIPALSLIEFQVGTPPFTVLFEPLAWAAFFGFGIGIAMAATRGWRWTGTTTGAAMFVIQALATAGNSVLGRSTPIPQLGLIVAGVAFDVARTNIRGKRNDTDAMGVKGIAVGAIVLVAAVGVERSVVGHTWWNGTVLPIGLVAAPPLAALGYAVGAGTITRSFFGSMRPLRLVGIAVAAFIFFSVSGYPILTRSPTRHIDVAVTLANQRLSVTTPHPSTFDQISAFRLVESSGPDRGSRLVWISTLERHGQTFRGRTPALGTDQVLIWYAHGVRHFYGTAETGDTETNLGENLSLSREPSLLGVFSVVSFVALLLLTYVSMMVLFRPDLLRGKRRIAADSGHFPAPSPAARSRDRAIGET